MLPKNETKTKTSHPIRHHIADRIRLLRTMRGVSQTKLADALGLTFQQIQKYERGANRVGGEMLWEIARALDVPVSFFFDGFEDGGMAYKPIEQSQYITRMAARIAGLPEKQQKAIAALVNAIAPEHTRAEEAA